MDSKCFFALYCILLVSLPTEISAIRPKTTMSKMANGLQLASQIKKLSSYRALSTQKKTGPRELVESLDSHAKVYPTVASKPVEAAAFGDPWDVPNVVPYPAGDGGAYPP